MDALIEQLRYLVRHPIRANVETLQAITESELGAAMVYLVRHPVRTLLDTLHNVRVMLRG